MLSTVHVQVIDAQDLSVAIQPDIPPYVMRNATKGFEVDLLHAVLPSEKVHFVQMPYAQLETAVPQGKAEVALSVRGEAGDVAYSKEYVTFANDAITRTTDDLKIADVADLKGHEVLTWEGAYRELGDEFEAQYAPQSPERKNYVEFADQEEQVRKFWEETGSVVVIDRSIFRYFSETMGHSPADADVHHIFPAVTNFKAAFKDAALRDEFNAGLIQACKTGEYAKLLRHYHMELPRTVCQ